METRTAKTTPIIALEYARELRSEARATRECLESVPMDKAEWKPHERSMALGYMVSLIADMPRWIEYAIKNGEIDFETYDTFNAAETKELIDHFDRGLTGAGKALEGMSDDDLKKEFRLKRGEQLLISSPLDEMISSTINHMVHHRGQLTVYLRMLDQKIPSIYGPSADTPSF